jgi:hypothetical protein
MTGDSEGLRFQPDTSGLGDAITGQTVAHQRVSSLDQRADRQLDGITVQRTFTDTVSGKDTDRPQLEAMLGCVRGGDTVIVHSMDRLARNLEDLRGIVRELTAKGVRVQFLTEQLTFTANRSRPAGAPVQCDLTSFIDAGLMMGPMNVLKVALGVVQSRGNKVVDPGLVVFGPDEADFLSRHVQRVRALTDSSARAVFSQGSRIPLLLDELRTAADTGFETTAKTLQDALAETMRSSTNASDCVFAVVLTGGGGSPGNEVTLLKLDAVVEAARMEFLSTGRVTLKVLKELLPEPGRLQKALSWPDPRAISDAIAIDTNVTSARYFENAFNLYVSPKSTQAESELTKVIVEHVPPSRIPDAFSAASALTGPMDDVLDELSEHGFPELAQPARDASADPRPTGVVRINKVAAMNIVWRADGAEVRVPPHLAANVTVERDDSDGWRIILKTRTQPTPGT